MTELTWSAPEDNNSPITKYTVSVCYVNDSTYCPGDEVGSGDGDLLPPDILNFTSTEPRLLLKVVPTYMYHITITATNDIGPSNMSGVAEVTGAQGCTLSMLPGVNVCVSSTPYYFLVSLSSLPLTVDAVPILNTRLVTDTLVLLSWSLPPLATLPDGISENDLPRPESRVMMNGYSLTRRNDPPKTLNDTNFLDNTVIAGVRYTYDLKVLYADNRIRDNIPVRVELEVDVPSSDGKQQMNGTQ